MMNMSTNKAGTRQTGGLAQCMLLTLLLSTATVAQERERIANEGTIGDKWMLADNAPLAMAQYPAHMAPRGDDVCIALEYVIDKNGGTSGFSVLKQWNSESGEKEPVNGFWQAFAQAGADAVSQWKFKPRPGVSNPVQTRTVAILGFNGKRDIDAAQLRSHCRIDDLASEIAQAKAKRFERGDIMKQAQEQIRINQREREMREQLKRANAGPAGG